MIEDFPSSLFNGTTVVENEMLKGSNFALLSDGTIHVSPAQMELLESGEGQDLKHFLENFYVVDLGHCPFFQPQVEPQQPEVRDSFL